MFNKILIQVKKRVIIYKKLKSFCQWKPFFSQILKCEKKKGIHWSMKKKTIKIEKYKLPRHEISIKKMFNIVLIQDRKYNYFKQFKGVRRLRPLQERNIPSRDWNFPQSVPPPHWLQSVRTDQSRRPVGGLGSG